MNTQNFFINPQCSNEVRFSLVHAALALLFVGILVTVLGLVLDCRQEVAILSHGGLDAVDKYRHSLQAAPVDSSFQCLMLALQWGMPTNGSNLQVLGLAICYLVAPTFIGVTAALRKFGTSIRPASAGHDLLAA